MSVSEGFQFEERVREGSAEGFRVREVPLDPSPNPNPILPHPPTLGGTLNPLNSLTLAHPLNSKLR